MLRLLRRLALFLAAASVPPAAVSAWVHWVGRSAVTTAESAESADAILVLGAGVFADGSLSPVLQDRLDTSLDLWRAGKAPRFLVSGDHGRRDYDEVNAMRRRLESLGVPAERIFCDHAGFDTYDSLRRARDVFLVRRVLIVTQSSHLPRALYIARRLGLEAQGVEADRRRYLGANWQIAREFAARIKAFLETTVERRPKHLGPVLPITGDGRSTHDRRD